MLSSSQLRTAAAATSGAGGSGHDDHVEAYNKVRGDLPVRVDLIAPLRARARLRLERHVYRVRRTWRKRCRQVVRHAEVAGEKLRERLAKHLHRHSVEILYEHRLSVRHERRGVRPGGQVAAHRRGWGTRGR